MFAMVKGFALRHLVADTPPMAPIERRKTAVGAMLGVILAGGMLALFPAEDIWLVAVLGATAIILFALPHSPLAQPWSVLGGYLVAAVASLAPQSPSSLAVLRGEQTLELPIVVAERPRILQQDER